MSIYLAWSLYKLAGMFLLWALLVFGLWKLTGWQKWPGDPAPTVASRRKVVMCIAVFWAALILLAAFNVGDRQQHLNRSSFNATFPVESPAYVPPPPDTVKAAREALDKNILELNNSIKERKQ